MRIVGARKEIALTSFGDAVKRKRCAMGLSQEELAELAELHRTYIGAIERGERNVSLRNIHRLAMALRMTASELMREAERGSRASSPEPEARAAKRPTPQLASEAASTAPVKKLVQRAALRPSKGRNVGGKTPSTGDR